MALFFDKAWFDAQLSVLGLTRADMATCVSITTDDLTLIFKDQMEVSAGQVQTWAGLFRESEDEIATRCGMSTRPMTPQTATQRITALEMRMAQLEAQINDLLKQQDAKL